MPPSWSTTRLSGNDVHTALRHAPAGVYTPAMHRTAPSSRPARSGSFRRRRALRLAAALPWLVLAAGCGQKGPLYHPPEPAEMKDEKKEDDEKKDE